MLELTRKADYALRVMVDVGAHRNGAVKSAEVAQRQETSYPFLPKVVQELVAAGLLVSERGAGGGLSLARAPKEISVLDIVRAMGPVALNRCTYHPPRCHRWKGCAVYPVWIRAQKEMERILERARLSRLIEQRLIDRGRRGKALPRQPGHPNHE